MRRICAGVGGNLNTSAASHRCSSWAQSSSSSTSVLLSGLGVQLPLIATDPYTVPGVSGRGRQSMSNNEDGEILAYRAPHESRQHRHARRSRSRDRKRPRNRSIERRRGDRDAHRNRRDHDRRTKRTSEVDNRRDRKHSTRRHDPQSSPVRNVRVNDVKPRAADVPVVNNDIVSSNGQPDNVSVEKPNHVDDTAITKPDQNGSLSNGDEPVAYNQYLTEIAVNAAASAEDDPAYLQRVEEQIQGILGQAEVVNVEEELERRRARRRALLLALEGDRAPVSDATPNDMSDITLVAEPSQQGLIYPAIPSTPVIIDGSKVKNVSDDDVDIFGDSPIAVVKPIDVPVVQVVPENVHLIDNWDDAEGYYSFRLGDVLHDGRYEVFANQGRGVFSTVLRVRDRLAGNRELVVKVIRQNDVMYKAGLKEVNLLKILGANDPDNHRHCIRLYSHFEHRGHLCLVFEPLHMNLREVLKKYGGVGINVDGVRSYAKQLFVALRLLVKCEIVHADIKPDNILVNASKNVLKLCDFGSAGMFTDCEITPYLVSRFYRAPEIILGLPYGAAIDVWAVGCVLFELYTGQILFKGADNNEMLLRIMELRGRFPPKLLRRATFSSQHFDEEWLFERRRTDKVTGVEMKTKMRIERPTRDLQALLRQSAGRLTEVEMKSLSQLRDLLEKCLMLDPAKRITPDAVRSHPFFQ